MRFARENRVRLQKDFDYIKENGVKADCSAFILYIAPPEEPREYSRLGVVASKRVGNSAIRHRAKRVFREIFRNSPTEKPMDILVFVRRGFLEFEFSALKAKFEKATSIFAKKLAQSERE
ncbi:MAG: ribonuclease P protein component [Opitutales bacterium]|nr:ribonuclease P protein component [Opitutales bacterium]